MSRETESATPAGTREDDKQDAVTSTADDNLDSSQEAGQPEESLLDAIEKSVGEVSEDETVGGEQDAEDEETASSEDDKPKGEASGDEGADDEAKAKADQADEEGEDDDGKDVTPDQKIPYDRFQKVVRQKNKFRTERDEYKTGHENFQAIQSFRERNNLSDQDVVQSLKIAAAINNDPARALEALTPIVDQLRLLVGETLPEDLQARVDQGELSEADAKVLAKTQNENRRLQQQQEQIQRARETEQQQTEQQQFRQGLALAASQKERELAGSDPDFEKKLPFVQSELQALMFRKPAQTPEAAAALVQEAYDNVSKRLSTLQRRPPVSKGPSSTGQGGTSTSSPQPKSMLDAMMNAVEGS